ncbi:MAG: RsfS/YbeB/iojap family protein, partial [Bombilactobacillus sp.]|nr:RsfS/YbeB/iojap family protein [Bombilactobacillus sp.]
KADFYDYRVEGSSESNWLLLDLGDVVVNVFTEEARDFYNVEKLWTSGKKLELEED